MNSDIAKDQKQKTIKFSITSPLQSPDNSLRSKSNNSSENDQSLLREEQILQQISQINEDLLSTHNTAFSQNAKNSQLKELKQNSLKNYNFLEDSLEEQSNFLKISENSILDFQMKVKSQEIKQNTQTSEEINNENEDIEQVAQILQQIKKKCRVKKIVNQKRESSKQQQNSSKQNVVKMQKQENSEKSKKTLEKFKAKQQKKQKKSKKKRTTYNLERIINHRPYENEEGELRLLILVKWERYSEKNATWEDCWKLCYDCGDVAYQIICDYVQAQQQTLYWKEENKYDYFCGIFDDLQKDFPDIDPNEYQILQYASQISDTYIIPEQIDISIIFHTGQTNQQSKLCLLHSFNMLLGQPYFRHVAQFFNILRDRKCKKQKEIEDQKDKIGISPVNLRGIVIINKKFMKLKFKIKWNSQQIYAYRKQKYYITNWLEDKNIFQAMICSDFLRRDGFIDKHVFILKKDNFNGWVLLDSVHKSPKYFNPKDNNLSKINIDLFFCQIMNLSVFIIAPDGRFNQNFKKEFEKYKKLYSLENFNETVSDVLKKESIKTENKKRVSIRKRFTNKKRRRNEKIIEQVDIQSQYNLSEMQEDISINKNSNDIIQNLFDIDEE